MPKHKESSVRPAPIIPQPSAEELRAKIAAEATERSNKALAAINEILKLHRCEIIAQPLVRDGLIVAQWGVGARE